MARVTSPMKQAIVPYWVGNTLIHAGDLLAPDDPNVRAIHVKDVGVVTTAT